MLKITPRRLRKDGWTFIEKYPFNGKMVWIKDKHLLDTGKESESYVYTPELDAVYSVVYGVKRVVMTMRELKKFYNFLKLDQ